MLAQQHVVALHRGLGAMAAASWAEASQQLSTARGLAQRAGDEEAEAEALLALARLQAALQQPVVAEQHLRAALRLNTCLELHVQLMEAFLHGKRCASWQIWRLRLHTAQKQRICAAYSQRSL